MAPEVITGKQYDASADIWSFGITALELAHGRAPHSRSPPASVLAHVATAPPPTLDRANGVHAYSAAFAEVVAMCLAKDPSKRPSAHELLASSFFRTAKKKGYLVGTVLKGLPPLTTRQERKRVPSVMTHATMESWDFSLREDAGSARHVSVASPTTSVHSLHSHARRPRSTLPSDGVFEIEDDDSGDSVPGRERRRSSEGGGTGVTPLTGEDAATYARRIRDRQRQRSSSTSSRTHAKNFPWTESIEEDSHSDSDSGNMSRSGSPDKYQTLRHGLGIRISPPLVVEQPPPPGATRTRTTAAPRTHTPPAAPSMLESSSATSRSSSTDPPEPATPPHAASSSLPSAGSLSLSGSTGGGFWRKLISGGGGGGGAGNAATGRVKEKGDREREREEATEGPGLLARERTAGGVSIVGGGGRGLVSARTTPVPAPAPASGAGGETPAAGTARKMKAYAFGGNLKLAAKTKVAQAGLVRSVSRPGEPFRSCIRTQPPRTQCCGVGAKQSQGKVR